MGACILHRQAMHVGESYVETRHAEENAANAKDITAACTYACAKTNHQVAHRTQEPTRVEEVVVIIPECNSAQGFHQPKMMTMKRTQNDRRRAHKEGSREEVKTTTYLKQLLRPMRVLMKVVRTAKIVGQKCQRGVRYVSLS